MPDSPQPDLSIGDFARRTGLTVKALRLYAEREVLVPVRVDPDTGYRWYSAGQVAHARLVARLRLVGLPLDLVREVCALPRGRAADAVEAFWEQVETGVQARRDLAEDLVVHLRSDPDGRTTTMTDPAPLTLRCAAATHCGPVRPSNQDAVRADGIVGVADGFGPAGAAASRAALDALDVPAGTPGPDVVSALRAAATRANDAIAGLEGESGTTLTAVVPLGSALALVHVGDSRAYLLREGVLRRLTEDHTLVARMVADGTLTPQEADVHPQRALLLRALAGRGDDRPDVRLTDVRPGDRFLLCSDGLAVVPPTDLERIVATGTPQDAVGTLVAAALDAGAPDNVSCVVADVAAA